MGPVKQNPIQRTVRLFIFVCITLCTIVAHNIAQNRPDSFPPYPPDNHHCSADVYLREGGWAVQKRLNWSRCRLGCGLKEPCIGCGGEHSPTRGLYKTIGWIGFGFFSYWKTETNPSNGFPKTPVTEPDSPIRNSAFCLIGFPSCRSL